MRDSTGYGVLKKIENRKLATLGLTQGHCDIVNLKDKMKIMKQELVIIVSIYDVHKIDKDTTKKEKEAQGEYHRLKATAAMKRLELNLIDFNKLTNPDIYDLLFVCYGKPMNSKKSGKSNSKPDFVNILA